MKLGFVVFSLPMRDGNSVARASISK